MSTAECNGPTGGRTTRVLTVLLIAAGVAVTLTGLAPVAVALAILTAASIIAELIA